MMQIGSCLLSNSSFKKVVDVPPVNSRAEGRGGGGCLLNIRHYRETNFELIPLIYK